MKKKVLISIGVSFSVFILTWLIYILLFSVSIVEGEAYNTKKLKKLSKQRELAYNGLYTSLHDKIDKIIHILYLKPIDNKNELEKHIIYNGDILLLDKINKNNLFYLSKEELRLLRNTIFAKYGYIFQSKDLSEHFNRFTWYKPHYSNVDERLSGNDRKIIEMIREAENEQINTDIQSVLEIFYTEAINIDKTYYQLMAECYNKFSFPFKNKKQCALNEVFPAKINVIKYNDQFYNEFALNIFKEQYEGIIKKIIEVKTNNIIEYINLYSNNYEIELLTITENFFDYYMNQCIISSKTIDKINTFNINLSGVSFFDIPVIEIDDVYYSSVAINELINSMKIISPYLIRNTKNILIEGVNYQTEIYSRNIDNYVNWYYSAITRIDKTIENIVGFFTGEKSVEEKYLMDNFNIIMNDNAYFDYVIQEDMDNLINIINNLFNEYLDFKNCFSVNFSQTTSNIITTNDFINPYIENIEVYFKQVFETLDDANYFYFQDYTVKDNDVVKTAKTSIKLLSNFNFLGGLIVDYLFLKTQEALNSSDLKQQIYYRMIENQKDKIAIINDPFNYLFDRLSIGSVLYVDNYFVGLNAYQHYGVYIGNGKVIHFAPLEGQEISSENGRIHETTLEKFLNGRALQIDKNIEKIYSENEIIQRARSRLGEKGYDLFTNNCEHFARWCVTGEHISYQVINSPQKIEGTILTIQENWDRVSKFIELFN
jgi:hypothetical protein